MKKIDPMKLRWAIAGMTRLDWANRMIGDTYCSFPDGEAKTLEMLNELQEAQDRIKKVHKYLMTYAWSRLESMRRDADAHV